MSSTNPYDASSTLTLPTVLNNTVTVKRIAPLPCANLMGATYGVLGLLLGGFFTVLTLFGADPADDDNWLLGVGAIIVMPIVYGVLGFLGGLVTAFVYNVVSGLVGGLQVEVERDAN